MVLAAKVGEDFFQEKAHEGTKTFGQKKYG